MIVTTYTCDKCGHEQTKRDDMWDIGILARTHGTVMAPGTGLHPYSSSKAQELWCRPCVVELGLLPVPKPKAKAAAKPPPETLVDKIRVIIREEIEASHGG